LIPVPGPDSDKAFWDEYRIRIQYGSRVLMIKIGKNLQLKKNLLFFYQKLPRPPKGHPSYKRSLHAFSPQKRTSTTSKHEIS
jgi:hypothetical protein